MRVLITGGLGYLGGRVASEVSRTHGWSVRLLHRPRTSPLPAWSDAFERVAVDLAAGEGLERALGGVDVVIHAAGASESDAKAAPEQARAVNVGGTRALAAAIRHTPVRRLIHMSTFHVYGRPLTEVIDESMPPAPQAPYGVLHLEAERAAGEAATAACDVTILRLSNAFGAPMDARMQRWNLVFNDLCRQAVEQGRMRLLSHGEHLRDFIAMPDVAGAIAHVASQPRAVGTGVFNLGSGHTVSIFEFATGIQQAFKRRGDDIPIERPAPRPEDVVPVRGRFDVSRLATAGFQPAGGHLQREVEATAALCRGGRQSISH